MRKQLEDFLIDLTDFYPIPSSKSFDKVIALSIDYLLQFCLNKEIDFKKALNSIFDKYKFKSFPELSVIKESLLESEVKHYGYCKDEGVLVVIEIPGIATYNFEISPMGRDLDTVKKEIISKYGNAKVSIYPKGTVMVGQQIMGG